MRGYLDMKKLVEYIIEKLDKTFIFEMAYDRRDYKHIVRGLVGQIVENWCLIRYCTLSNRTETKNHWQNELSGHLINIYKMKIKLDKRKCLNEELIYNPEHNDYKEVFKWIKDKFIKEDINDNKLIYQVAKDYAEYGVYDIIDILCDKNADIYDYVKNEI